jgi:hypothetical protein
MTLLAFDIAGLSPPSEPLLRGVGFLAISYGVIDITTRAVQDIRALRRIYHRPLGDTPLNAPYEDPYDRWARLTLDGAHAVTDPAVNQRLLRDERIPARAQRQELEAGGQVRGPAFAGTAAA